MLCLLCTVQEYRYCVYTESIMDRQERKKRILYSTIQKTGKNNAAKKH